MTVPGKGCMDRFVSSERKSPEASLLRPVCFELSVLGFSVPRGRGLALAGTLGIRQLVGEFGEKTFAIGGAV